MSINDKKGTWIILAAVILAMVVSLLVMSHEKTATQEGVAATLDDFRAHGFKTELADFAFINDTDTHARTAALLFLNHGITYGKHPAEFLFLPGNVSSSAQIMWQQPVLPTEFETISWQNLHDQLDSNGPALDAACLAAASGPIRFDVDSVNPGMDWGPDISHLQYLQTALVNRMLLDLHEGRRDSAWTNLFALTRLATGWQSGPAAFSHLFRCKFATAAFYATWQALPAGGWTDDQLAALQTQWESFDAFDGLPDAVALDRIRAFLRCRHLVEVLPLAVRFSLQNWTVEMRHHPRAALAEAKMRYHVFQERSHAFELERDLLLQERDREIQFRQAGKMPSWAAIRTLPAVTKSDTYGITNRDVAELIASSQSGETVVLVNAAQAEARRRILVTAIALERYHGRLGAYPAGLTALAPEFLKTVPDDFMDGRPLRYRLTDDSHFVLYSVGLDGVDNGGALPSPRIPSAQIANDGRLILGTNADIVWPRPNVAGAQLEPQP